MLNHCNTKGTNPPGSTAGSEPDRMDITEDKKHERETERYCDSGTEFIFPEA